MIIDIDWADLPNTWSDDVYRVVEDFWEDGSEWAHLEILDTNLQQWIRQHHSDWIIADHAFKSGTTTDS